MMKSSAFNRFSMYSFICAIFLFLFNNSTSYNSSSTNLSLAIMDYPQRQTLDGEFPNSLISSYQVQTNNNGPNIVKKIFDNKNDLLIVSAPLDPYLNESLNNGRFREISNAVEEAAISIIKRAPPGEELRISIFAISSQRMFDEIYNAARRGAIVKLLYSQAFGNRDDLKRLVLDFKNRFNTLKLTHIKYRNISFERCSTSEVFGGCMGAERNHNKFILAEKLCRLPATENGCKNEKGQNELASLQKIVFQSTMNFTIAERHQHNMAMIFVNREPLFSRLKTYHRDLSNKVNRPGLNKNYGNVFDVSFLNEMAIKLYISPTQNDYAAEQLSRIKCVKETNPQQPQDSIRIIMGHWQGRSDILRLLKKHHNEGCAIRVILPFKALDRADPMNAIYKELQKQKIKIHVYPEDFFGGVHSKLVLIKARYNGSNHLRKIILWGSHNYTDDAIYYNDETWYEMEGSNNSLFHNLGSAFFTFRTKIQHPNVQNEIDNGQ